MSDRRLQVFHSVARHLSFTKAAEALHMTQPAVTFQVRQLEEQFNTRLFDRTHNRISLTEAGERALLCCCGVSSLSIPFHDRCLHLNKKLFVQLKKKTMCLSGSISSARAFGEFRRIFGLDETPDLPGIFDPWSLG